MQKQNWNENWTFAQGSGSAMGSMLSGEQAVSKPVTLPHDASIEQPRRPDEPNGSGNGFFHEGSYHYVKEWELPEEEEGKEVYIEFEGVYQNAYVYVNNSFAGQHAYGYGNFYIDATPYVKFGEKNEVKVVVKNEVPSGRWYSGSGIYRDVNLLIGDRLHLAPDQVHLRTLSLEEDLAVVQADALIDYHGTGVRDITLQVQLLNEDGSVAAQNEMPVTVLENGRDCSAAGGSAGYVSGGDAGKKYSQKLFVKNPNCWDPDHPCLYHYRAAILEKGKVIDEDCGTFGIRLLQMDPEHGLRINGKAYKLRGGCIHHDNGVTGTAEFAHAAEYRVQGMKDAGYNAIRSSHYPMSRCLLNACDKLGMLVMDEFSDVWTTTKVDFDYGTQMSLWWKSDLTNMVNKDYNHPCVILYSLGNEIPETGDKFDAQWGKCLADQFRAQDPGRFVTNSLNLMLSVMGRMDAILPSLVREKDVADVLGEIGDNPEINSLMSKLGSQMNLITGSDAVGDLVAETASQVDAIGYNYSADRYEKDIERYPNQIFIGSETNPPDLDYNWPLVEKYPQVLGDFTWTAWDYLGEAGIGKIDYDVEEKGFSFYAPYPCKAAYCGDINLLGERRPTSYWREIIWGLRSEPYLAVQPPAHYGQKKSMSQWCMTDAVSSWTWSGYEGKPVVVEVYAEAEEAALYLDGTLIEKKPVGGEKRAQVKFDTVYQPGKLEAVVYTGGKEVGRTMLQTAGKPELRLLADRKEIPADGSDICYVEIYAEDAEGILNKDVKDTVNIAIEGPGVIQGYGSADPESEENYYDRSAKLYEGKLRAAIRGCGEKGTIRVTCSGENLKEKTVSIQAI